MLLIKKVAYSFWLYYVIFNYCFLQHNEDIHVAGYVSWVGKSSVEITVWLEQHIHGAWTKVLNAIFLMAVRNSTNTKGTFVNKLVPADEEEKRIFAEAESKIKWSVIELSGSVCWLILIFEVINVPLEQCN